MTNARNRGRPKELERSTVRTPLVERLSSAAAPVIPMLHVVAGQDVLSFALLDKRRPLEVGCADTALYAASRGGRNRVLRASALGGKGGAS